MWICFRSSQDFPCKSWCYILSYFQFPYVTWEGSIASMKFVFKRFDMIIIPLFFKLSFSQFEICFFRVAGFCCTFVYHGFLSAITIKGTICLNSTVKLESLFCFFLNNLFLVPFEYLLYVLSTAIAYFNVCILIYNLIFYTDGMCCSLSWMLHLRCQLLLGWYQFQF